MIFFETKCGDGGGGRAGVRGSGYVVVVGTVGKRRLRRSFWCKNGLIWVIIDRDRVD
jgi:hypothetical protein